MRSALRYPGQCVSFSGNVRRALDGALLVSDDKVGMIYRIGYGE